jgi:lysophospholipase L1-like esterase
MVHMTPQPVGRAGGASATVLAVVLAVLLAVPLTAQAAAPARYAALGDSYVSAPFLLPLRNNPLTCLRSEADYPALVTQALGIGSLRDVSCSGARILHMTTSQEPGQPPQFEALSSKTDLVTVGIGFNDGYLSRMVTGCPIAGLIVIGKSCRDRYVVDGYDTILADIQKAAPKLSAMLDGIHARSPLARVLLVGYPQIVPGDGRSCQPIVPLSGDDNRYLDGLLRALNDELEAAAGAHDAEYVDLYAASIGHDMCTAPGTKWWEGAVPTALAAPLHPNALGVRAQAEAVLATLATPRPAPVISDLAAAHAQVTSGRKARFGYRLNRAAPVTFVVRRRATGRVKSGRCRPLRVTTVGEPPCLRWTRPRRTLTRDAQLGSNAFVLGARRMHKPGVYRLFVTAATGDAVSDPVTTDIRVISKRKP